MDTRKETQTAIDESNKRKRSVTSTSEVDTSMNVDQETNKSMVDEQSNKADKKKTKSTKKKAKKAKKADSSDDEWIDESFKDSIQSQLAEISVCLTKVVSKTEIETIFSKLFEKKLREMITDIKDKIIESVTHKIEVLEGELHGTNIENEKLRSKIQKLEKDIEMTDETVNKLQRSLEDTDRAFYGRSNELEQYSRRNNIRIWGIPEKVDGEKYESMETTVSLVVKTLNEKMGLNLENRDIDIAHRIGKKMPNQPDRCIIAKFTSRLNKMKSLKDRKKKLQGTNIKIQEDLTKLNLAVLKATWKNDDVERSWTTEGAIYVKWVGSGNIKKLGFNEYSEWLENMK